jgi:maltose O-acetyltransferase
MLKPTRWGHKRLDTKRQEEVKGKARLSARTGRWLDALYQESGAFHFKLVMAQLVLAPLPLYVGTRLRAMVLRLAGFRIGRGTVLWGTPTITGSGDLYKRLIIGDDCWLNAGCFFDLGAPITIGNRIAFGHQVLLMTGSHTLGGPERRCGSLFSRPITIEDGAWIGSRATILPGVTIGAGAVVAAGATVTADVPPNTLVAGTPARVKRSL